MYKLVNPWTNEVVGYSELNTSDEMLHRTSVDEHGVTQVESIAAECVEIEGETDE